MITSDFKGRRPGFILLRPQWVLSGVIWVLQVVEGVLAGVHTDWQFLLYLCMHFPTLCQHTDSTLVEHGVMCKCRW